MLTAYRIEGSESYEHTSMWDVVVYEENENNTLTITNNITNDAMMAATQIP